MSQQGSWEGEVGKLIWSVLKCPNQIVLRSGSSNRPPQYIRPKTREQKHSEVEKFKPVSAKAQCKLGLSAPCSRSALLIILPGSVSCLLGLKILFPWCLVETYYSCSPGFTEAFISLQNLLHSSFILLSLHHIIFRQPRGTNYRIIPGHSYGATKELPCHLLTPLPQHSFLWAPFCWKGRAGKQMWPVLLQDLLQLSAAALSVKSLKGTGRKEPVIPVVPATWWQEQLIPNANTNVKK